MNRRWICTDVWMDILPSFDRHKLGLNLALLSYRFDVLVDKHFDGKTTQLTIWRPITIFQGFGPKPKMSVRIDGKFVDFPFPDRPLPNRIRFRLLQIEYIDHSVITFLHSNKQIWDRSGTKIKLFIENYQSIWDVFTREIWPIFATNIRHLHFARRDHLDNLRRHISPTLLTDLKQLNSITSDYVLPDVIADDGPNSTAGQALSKWLHTPTKNGQSKKLFCCDYLYPLNLEWVNNFKETFLRATTSVSYKIEIISNTTPIEPFEWVNERTNEKLTLKKDGFGWLLKRCPIIAKTVAQKDENLDHLNGIRFSLNGNCIGPLSPPTDQSD